MLRAAILVLLASIALTACDDSGPTQALQGVPQFTLTSGLANARAPHSGESYIYDHTLAISMASDFIKARFERARDRCQNDAALKCRVMTASFALLGNPSAPLPTAFLSVALPHESVAPFEASLTAPLPGEDASDVIVRSRSLSAQNVTQQVTDLDRRLAQLTDYRDRMAALAKRGGVATDDLIKIEGELSKTQSEIEQLDAQKRQLAERIAKENMNISFEPQSTAGDAFRPVREVWQSALRILGASAGDALGFFIRALPWIPILALAIFLIRWLWRRVRRAKT